MDAMNRFVRVIARIAVIAGASTLALSAGPHTPSAVAAPSCAERVIADWSDNGRIDRVYPLDCYEAAIDTIPVDLRDYTNAADVISRALTAAARQQPPTGGAGATALEATPAADASNASSIPLPLIVVVAVALLVLGAGVISHFTRRHRATRPAD
jgi:hypothetical protein